MPESHPRTPVPSNMPVSISYHHPLTSSLSVAPDLVARLDASEADTRNMRENLARLAQEVRSLELRPQTMSLANVDHPGKPMMALQHIDELLRVWDGTTYHKEWVKRGVRSMHPAEDEDIQRHGRIQAFAHEMRLHLERARVAGLFIPRSDVLNFTLDSGIQATGAGSVGDNITSVTGTELALSESPPVLIPETLNLPSGIRPHSPATENEPRLPPVRKRSRLANDDSKKHHRT